MISAIFVKILMLVNRKSITAKLAALSQDRSSDAFTLISTSRLKKNAFLHFNSFQERKKSTENIRKKQFASAYWFWKLANEYAQKLEEKE